MRLVVMEHYAGDDGLFFLAIEVDRISKSLKLHTDIEVAALM